MSSIKFLAGMVLALMIGTAVFYIGWLRHPSPDQVCAHLDGVAKRAFGDPSQCRQTLTQGALEGVIPYAAKMKCLRRATSVDAINSLVELMQIRAHDLMGQYSYSTTKGDPPDDPIESL